MEAVIRLDTDLGAARIQELFNKFREEHPSYVGKVDFIAPPPGSLGVDHKPKLIFSFTRIAELASIVSLVLSLCAPYPVQPEEEIKVIIVRERESKNVEISIPASGDCESQLSLQLKELIGDQDDSTRMEITITTGKK